MAQQITGDGYWLAGSGKTGQATNADGSAMTPQQIQQVNFGSSPTMPGAGTAQPAPTDNSNNIGPQTPNQNPYMPVTADANNPRANQNPGGYGVGEMADSNTFNAGRPQAGSANYVDVVGGGSNTVAPTYNQTNPYQQPEQTYTQNQSGQNSYQINSLQQGDSFLDPNATSGWTKSGQWVNQGPAKQNGGNTTLPVDEFGNPYYNTTVRNGKLFDMNGSEIQNTGTNAQQNSKYIQDFSAMNPAGQGAPKAQQITGDGYWLPSSGKTGRATNADGSAMTPQQIQQANFGGGPQTMDANNPRANQNPGTHIGQPGPSMMPPNQYPPRYNSQQSAYATTGPTANQNPYGRPQAGSANYIDVVGGGSNNFAPAYNQQNQQQPEQTYTQNQQSAPRAQGDTRPTSGPGSAQYSQQQTQAPSGNGAYLQAASDFKPAQGNQQWSNQVQFEQTHPFGVNSDGSDAVIPPIPGAGGNYAKPGFFNEQMKRMPQSASAIFANYNMLRNQAGMAPLPIAQMPGQQSGSGAYNQQGQQSGQSNPYANGASTGDSGTRKTQGDPAFGQYGNSADLGGPMNGSIGAVHTGDWNGVSETGQHDNYYNPANQTHNNTPNSINPATGKPWWMAGTATPPNGSTGTHTGTPLDSTNTTGTHQPGSTDYGTQGMYGGQFAPIPNLANGAPDYMATANAQSQYDYQRAIQQAQLNNPDQYGPNGSQVRSQNPDGSYSLTTTLNGQLQSNLNAYNDVQGKMYQKAQDLAGGSNSLNYSGVAGGPQFNASGAPGLNGMDASGVPGLNGLNTSGVPGMGQFDTSGVSGIPQADVNNLNATRDSMYQQSTQYLDPQWKQSQSDMESRLANQGIMPGSDAYLREMNNFNLAKQKAYGDARNSAIQAGGAEQSRLFGLGLQANQAGEQNAQRQFDAGQQQHVTGMNDASTAFGAGVQQHNSGMSDASTLFGAGLQAHTAGMNDALTGFNTGMQTRQQGVSEQNALHNADYNDLASLRGMQAPTMPTFQGQQGVSIPGTNFLNAANMQANTNLGIKNANAAQHAQNANAAYGLGSAFLMSQAGQSMLKQFFNGDTGSYASWLQNNEGLLNSGLTPTDLLGGF